MAKVTVAYADLEETSTAMTTLNDYVKDVHNEVVELKSSFEDAFIVSATKLVK